MISHKVVTASTEFPLGKNKGMLVGDMKASTLLWFADQAWFRKTWPAFATYIEQHREALEKREEDATSSSS